MSFHITITSMSVMTLRNQRLLHVCVASLSPPRSRLGDQLNANGADMEKIGFHMTSPQKFDKIGYNNYEVPCDPLIVLIVCYLSLYQ